MGHAKSKDHSRRRLFSRALVLGTLVATSLCAIAMYRHLVDPVRIRRLAIDQLEQATGRKVTIDSATFSIRDGMQLREVFISHEPTVGAQSESTPAADDSLLTCHEISILPNPWALIRGRLEIESFEAIRPTLTLIHHADTGWSRIAQLFRDLAPTQEGASRVPQIELRHARVRLLHRSSAGEKEVEDFQLTVRGRNDRGNPDYFDLVWQDAIDPDANGHTQIHLPTGRIRNIRGGLPGMSIRGIFLAADAGYDGALELARTYGIRGRLRVRDFDVSPAVQGDAPRFAKIEIQDAALSIPLSEEETRLGPDARHLRLNNISGTVTVDHAGLTVDVNAQAHQSRISATASINGPLRVDTFVDDLQLNATVRALDVELPDRKANDAQRRFVESWAPMDRFYDRFDPRGKIDVSLHVEKQPGRPFRINDAQIEAREGSASFHEFPYRVEDIRGSIVINEPNGVQVRQICGKHGETLVCLDGWMEAPRSHVAARFTIAGNRVNIEKELLEAMEPHVRQWMQSYSVAGTADVVVMTSRPRTDPQLPPAPWDTVVELNLTNVAASVPLAPARITGLTGQAKVWSDRIELSEARGTVASGDLTVSGVALVTAEGLENLSLELAINDAVLEHETVELMPDAVRTRLRDFGTMGCASVQAQMEYDEQSGWNYDANVQLRNLQLRPMAFPLPIDRAFADLRIVPDLLTIERARGFHGEAELFAKGQIAFGEERSVDLVLEADRLPLDEEFRAALPAPVQDALTDWRVETPIRVEGRVNGHASDFTWNGQVRLDQATVAHRVLPQPLRDVDATVSFSRDEVRSSSVRANYGAASISGNFKYQIDDGSRTAEVAFRANDVPLDRSIRNLLPPGGQRTWDELQPEGTVRLHIDSMRYQFDEASAAPTWSLGGNVELVRAGLAQDTVLAEGTTITLDGWLLDRLGGVTIYGQLKGGTIDIFGETVENPTATWLFARTSEGRGQGALRDFRGRVHGGTAATQGVIQFDAESARYRVATSLQDVDLAPWLTSWRSRNSTGDPRESASSDAFSEVRGRMAAQLHLSGLAGNPETRTGGGRVEIRDGYIYKLPIFVAILKVLNISIPRQDVLTEAGGQFYVTGNTVRIADIDVTGESLVLIGEGTLSLSDQSVDLRLVNAGAGRLEGIPVLAELWRGASRQIVELRVTGPLSNPQVRAMPFGGVTEEIKKLFQRRQPRRTVQSASP